MNVTAHINKAIKTLGLMGIMMALAGFLATSTAPASADKLSNIQPLSSGQVVVYADALSSSTDIVAMEVVVTDVRGNSVTKGVIYGSGKLSAQLPTGDYKVSVSAKGYNTYGEAFKIEPNGTTIVKTVLVPLGK